MKREISYLLDLALNSPYNFFMLKPIERSFSFFLSILFGFLFLGCSPEQAKKSESSGRITGLYSSLDQLKKSFESKDSAALLSGFSPAFNGLDRVKKKTPEYLLRTGSVSLKFQVDHIILEPSLAEVQLRWERSWTLDSGTPVKDGGTALLKFSAEALPLLLEINGSSPFSPPSREKPS